MLCISLKIQAQVHESFSEIYFKYNNFLTFKPIQDSIPEFSMADNSNYYQYYTAHLGAFCKLENKVLSKNHLPIKMRLGSVQYVDILEQKLPAYLLLKEK
jgi:hypothetical protein